MKKICLLSSIYIVIFIAFTGCAQKNVTENNFTKWVNNSKPISALKDYVKTVTDEKSKNFIPKEDRLAVFDLDGTLTDPGLGITNSVQYALRQFGIDVQDRRELYPFIGPPLSESFVKFYGFTEEKAQEAVAQYRVYFADTGIFENAVYPGIPELLKALNDAGMRPVLATSKPAVFAERILEHFDLK
mgnify:CR=1 FL=1